MKTYRKYLWSHTPLSMGSSAARCTCRRTGIWLHPPARPKTRCRQVNPEFLWQVEHGMPVQSWSNVVRRWTNSEAACRACWVSLMKHSFAIVFVCRKSEHIRNILWLLLKLYFFAGGGPRVVVNTAAFHARVRGSVPGLGGLKETKNVSSPSTCES